jgi:hypothetical protein
LIELIGRYRDDPWRAMRTRWAIAYMIINGAAALLALYLLEVWRPEWVFGPARASIDTKTRVTAVLIAGFGAVALFRSSLLKLKSPEGEMSIGPNVILDTLLRAVDRAVDRTMARNRAASVAQIMENISFERARAGLPAYCFTLMQNVPLDEQQRFGNQLNSYATSDMDNRIKALNLGLGLLNIVGVEVLERAVADIRPLIRSDLPLADQPVSRVEALMVGIDYDNARAALPNYCAAIRVVAEGAAKAVAEGIVVIDATVAPGAVKSLMLGMTLVRSYGFDVVELAIRDIGPKLHALDPAQIAQLTAGVDYSRARSILPAYCQLLRPISEEAKQLMATKILTFDASSVSADVKCLMLGMVLAQSFGVDALAFATNSLGNAIRP